MLLQRISIDPQICFGKPCIRGTRIWVSLILDMLSDGTSVQEILAAYPHIKREDVLACIAYGSAMSIMSKSISKPHDSTKIGREFQSQSG